MKKGSTIAAILAGLAVVLSLLIVLLPKLQIAPEGQSLGGVTVGNEYMSTTSSPWLTIASPTVLKAGPGTLGSVIVVNSPLTMSYTFLNATTSDVNLRTNNKATTTLIIAASPSSATVGTYVYDVNFTDGLLVVPSGTAAGTTTITWR